jgi:hypothetical protein
LLDSDRCPSDNIQANNELRENPHRQQVGNNRPPLQDHSLEILQSVQLRKVRSAW